MLMGIVVLNNVSPCRTGYAFPAFVRAFGIYYALFFSIPRAIYRRMVEFRVYFLKRIEGAGPIGSK